MVAPTRIIANTIASYARLFALALVGLIATPIALHVLGTVEFGIFSVIAGSLAMLMFVNTALTTGAQRHIAYSLGEGSKDEAARWFTTSLVVHSALAMLVACAALLGSNWVLLKLNFPAARLATAAWVYRMVLVVTICNFISTPYQALLMAHESIVALSLLSILSAVSLVAGVYKLHLLHGDSLLWYAAIYSFSQIVMFVGPIFYCLFRYPECRRLASDNARWRRIGELLSFSGWNFFGALAAIVRAQGPAILLNLFVGPVANASYGIALQVNGFATNVGSGVLRATTPPIVKCQAAGNRRGMAVLSNLSNTFAFGSLWVAIAPVLFEREFCLKVWLHGTIPPNACAFVSLLLIALLIDQLTSGFMASLQATGRIAGYQLVVGSVNCIAVPIGYFLLRSGKSAPSILQAGIAGAVLAGLCRLGFAQKIAMIPVSDWIRAVLVPTTACVAVSSASMLLVQQSLPAGPVRFAAIVLANAIVACTLMWQLGTTEDHKFKIRSLVSGRLLRIYPRFRSAS